MESKLVIFYLFIFCLWQTLTQNYLSKEGHLSHYIYLRCFFWFVSYSYFCTSLSFTWLDSLKKYSTENLSPHIFMREKKQGLGYRLNSEIFEPCFLFVFSVDVPLTLISCSCGPTPEWRCRLQVTPALCFLLTVSRREIRRNRRTSWTGDWRRRAQLSSPPAGSGTTGSFSLRTPGR